MFSLKGLVLLGIAFASWASAKSSSGNSVLVVVEPNRKDDFSIFFDGLKGEFELNVQFIMILTDIRQRL